MAAKVLMGLFGSIIDQSQVYIGFLIIHLMMVPWLFYDASNLNWPVNCVTSHDVATHENRAMQRSR